MATPGGTEHPDIAPPETVRNALGEIERDLRQFPGRFDFFQAVRLLIRLSAGGEPVGRFVAPDREALRFGVNHSLSFPPSQVHAIDWSGEIPRMTVNFMGLTGPLGTLPYAYSELINERLRNRDRGLADFFDIFNHRAISLFYQAWEKYRFAVAYERDGVDRVSRLLASLMGIGTEGLQDRLAVRDEALIFYTGLLGLQPRSAAGLRNILEDYFNVPVEVEQFVGSWQPLAPSDRCVFGSASSFSEQLGGGAVAGDAIWDRQSRIRLKLGPLDQEHYLGFLPSGGAWQPLRALATFYCGSQMEIEVQLILKREQVPRCDLGDASAGGPRLGWFTWMKSGTEFDRDPGEAILLLT
ncbi:MAG TPA: type VI secretion system baseplate subunit TssG [Candidatus Acidoferrales bacterium]|jgi:type VI secretion system protein ImpH|nr:type VI secretion system baseplate subunit TssG [Candidatus Acidoferrales bacterium]